MEKRKATVSKSSPLPDDFVANVSDVFTTHFEDSLKALENIAPQTRFETRGEVYSDEILLAVSLVTEGQLAATTVYASTDFDPKASSPSVHDLISACVDAIGAVFEPLLHGNPETLEALMDESLSALNDVPFEWTETESNKKKLYLKIDKSNLAIDALAEDWLQKNDPNYEERLKQEQEETEKLFVTGPSSMKNKGKIH